MPVTIGGSGPITGVTSINTSVSDTELGYLDGVTSALQTQINAKANDSSQGLYFITAQDFSAGSFVNVNGCFTSTYTNYRVILRITSASADSQFQMRMRNAGADATGNDYGSVLTGSNETTGPFREAAMSAAQNRLYYQGATSAIATCSIDIYSPQAAVKTQYTSLATTINSAAVIQTIYSSGGHNLTNSYDSLTVFPASGNVTGRIAVYGYRAS